MPCLWACSRAGTTWYSGHASRWKSRERAEHLDGARAEDRAYADDETRVHDMRAVAIIAAIVSTGLTPDNTISIVSREFIYDSAPFRSAHASTIVETEDGLVAAWFGGTAEKRPDVAIWSARRNVDGWSPPMQVADGVQAGGRRFPTWNPVLFQLPAGHRCMSDKWGRSPREGGGR